MHRPAKSFRSRSEFPRLPRGMCLLRLAQHRMPDRASPAPLPVGTSLPGRCRALSSCRQPQRPPVTLVPLSGTALLTLFRAPASGVGSYPGVGRGGRLGCLVNVRCLVNGRHKSSPWRLGGSVWLSSGPELGGWVGGWAGSEAVLSSENPGLVPVAASPVPSGQF